MNYLLPKKNDVTVITAYVVFFIFLGVFTWTNSLEVICYAITPKNIFFGASIFYIAQLVLFLACWRFICKSAISVVAICGGMLWLFNGGGLAIAQLLSPPNKEILLFSYFFDVYLPISEETVFQALTFSSSCLCFFFVGSVVGFFKVLPDGNGNKKNESKRLLDKSKIIQISLARKLGLFLLAVSILPYFLIMFRSASVARTDGYMGLFTNSSYVRGSFGALASGFIPACFYLLTTFRTGSRFWLICISLLFAGVFPYMFFGDRGLIFSVFGALIWLWHVSVRPIKTSYLIGAVLILLIISRAIFLARLDNTRLLGIEDIIAGVEGIRINICDALSELGMSLATVAYTMDFVPITRDFEYGKTYWYAFLSIFPSFIFPGGEHPTWQRGEEAAWLIRIVSPRTAAASGGLGYSLIAESYLNFGYIFGSIFFTLIGWICGFVQRYVTLGKRPWRLAAGAIFLSISMLAARGESLMVMRRLCTLVLVPCLCVELIGKKSQWFQRRYETDEGCDVVNVDR